MNESNLIAKISLPAHATMMDDAGAQGALEVHAEKIKRLLARLDWGSLLAFSLPLVLYLLTMAPTIYNLDSAELTTAAYTGGLMRATGYPLYLSIGMLWSRLPLGDVGYRMNLLSAVSGAGTILLAERILRRWRVGIWATIGALGLLATSTFFWGLSLVAEVYTPHTALMAGFILVLLCWSDDPTPKRLFWVGLLGGLGLTHHAAMMLLGPASLVFLLISHPRQLFSLRSLGAVMAGTLLGLTPYLYLPIRYLANPVFNYAGVYDAILQFHPVDLTSLAGLWWLVSGKAFAGAMMAYHGADLWRETQAFLVQLGRAFFAVGIGSGILGMLLLWRKNWREPLLLSGMFVFSAGFYINYRVMDKDTMYLPAYLIWALWVGLGTQGVLDWLRGVDGAKAYQRTQTAVKAMIVTSVLLALAWNWRIVDLSGDLSTRQRGEAILKQAEPGSLVFGWWDTVPAIQYLQLVEGQRPDVKAINRFLIDPRDMAYAIQKEVKQHTVYIDSSSKELSTTLVAKPAGQIYRLEFRQSTNGKRGILPASQLAPEEMLTGSHPR